MKSTVPRRASCVALLIVGWIIAPAPATWSIVVVDTETREIAVGSATCLVGFDLLRNLPAVRVDVGAGVAQSRVDSTAINRQRIWNGLIAGTDPEQILNELIAGDPDFSTRQYGIVDTRGRAITYTGVEAGAFANGLTGRVGSLVYAIQGNVITGPSVLTACETAFLNTPGAFPEKLMAAMEAARAQGGDGRCSCSSTCPTCCGAPPPSFTASAYIAFMLVTRRGDSDWPTCNPNGCARGTYYMNLNITAIAASQGDAVNRLRTAFDAWRPSTNGVPDQVASGVSLSRSYLPPDGVTQAVMTIDLRDWRGQPPSGVSGVAVVHDPRGSAGRAALGPVEDLGGGRYQATLTAGAAAGLDTLAVRVSYGTQQRFLLPSTRLRSAPGGDMDCDGAVTFNDLEGFVTALASAAGYAAAFPNCDYVLADVNVDGAVNFDDIAPFVAALVAGG